MSINTKLLEVFKKLEGQGPGKKGKNTFSNYTYVREIDAIRLVAPFLNEVGIIHRVNLIQSEIEVIDRGDAWYSTAKVVTELILVDAETNEHLIIKSAGYAEDKKGDKALYKAMTGASKYAYLKAFGLGSGEDPENDEKDQKKDTPQRSAQPPQNPRSSGPMGRPQTPVTPKPVVQTKNPDHISNVITPQSQPAPKPEVTAAIDAQGPVIDPVRDELEQKLTKLIMDLRDTPQKIDQTRFKQLTGYNTRVEFKKNATNQELQDLINKIMDEAM